MPKRYRGFSLIELLIVVAIILIIAAIAIPNLVRAKIQANEAAAAQGVRVITTAEVQYNTAYGNSTQGYTDLPSLGGTEPCSPAPTSSCILDQQLSSGAKEGYSYSASPQSPTALGADSEYTAGAQPENATTGTRTFCAASDGTIWATPPSGTVVPIPTSPTVCHSSPFVAVPGD